MFGPVVSCSVPVVCGQEGGTTSVDEIQFFGMNVIDIDIPARTYLYHSQYSTSTRERGNVTYNFRIRFVESK